MIKNNFRILKKPLANLQTIAKAPVKFQKDWPKTVGGVEGTRYLLKSGTTHHAPRTTHYALRKAENNVPPLFFEKAGDNKVCLQIKKWRFQNTESWPNLSMLFNLTLLCRLLSIEIKVSGIKCLFKILLVIGYASIPRHRPKTSGRNIWLVASNLTSGIHCAVVFHLIFLMFGSWTDWHIQSENKFICRPTMILTW